MRANAHETMAPCVPHTGKSQLSRFCANILSTWTEIIGVLRNDKTTAYITYEKQRFTEQGSRAWSGEWNFKRRCFRAVYCAFLLLQRRTVLSMEAIDPCWLIFCFRCQSTGQSEGNSSKVSGRRLETDCKQLCVPYSCLVCCRLVCSSVTGSLYTSLKLGGFGGQHVGYMILGCENA